MSSSYPGGLDAFVTTRADGTAMATNHPADHNNYADAINKIEAELGTDPSGTYATVKDRITQSAEKPYSQILTEGVGLKGENFYRGAVGSVSQTFANQTVYYTLLPLRAGDIVTNMYFVCNGVVQTITTNKMGLYTTASSRVAISANNTTNLATGPTPAFVLTSPYTVPTTGVYYAALLVDATTPGAFVRGASITTVVPAVAGGPFLSGTQTGQADLPATATISSSGGGLAWVGWN